MRLLLAAILSFSIVQAIGSQPLDTPVPLCVAVEPNGDITITWQPISDPFGVFDHYEIFHQATGASVTSVAGIGSNQATIAGYNGQTASHSFYIKAIADGSGPWDSGNSNTISSIFLNVTNPSNGTAILSWNSPFVNLPVGSSSYYRIYKQIVPSGWALHDSVPITQTLYTDTIYTCTAAINYRVELENASGCTSVSSVDGDVFADVLPPYIPQISSVSVDTSTGQAIVSWNQNAAPDTYGYIILQFDPTTGWSIIDTVYGASNTSYTATLNGAASGSETYAVAAIDDCLTGVPPSYNTSPASTQHSSIFLQGDDDVCGKTISLNFNGYQNWQGVLRYELYMQSGGGVYVLLANLSPTQLQFTTAGLTPGIRYSFVVKAIGTQGEEALSNKLEVILNQPPQPNYNYVQTASVNFDGTISIRVHADELAELQAIRIERSPNGAAPFFLVDYNQVVSNPVEITDEQVDPNEKFWYYRAVAIDSCGNEALLSNVARTIHLTAEADQLAMQVSLKWTPYEGWNGNVVGYDVYRALSNGSAELVASLNAAATSYQDYAGDLINENGSYRYFVVARESLNAYGLQESARSNAALVRFEPLVWIPNAFTPNGLNPIFLPQIAFDDPLDFRMFIYNRWGEMIYETNDPYQGWDGYGTSGIMPQDVYVYKVYFKASNGTTYERQGSVTLLR